MSKCGSYESVAKLKRINMSKVAIVAIALCFVPLTVGATECPDDGKLMLAGARTVCVAKDKKGRCKATEQRLLVYCAPSELLVDEVRFGSTTSFRALWLKSVLPQERPNRRPSATAEKCHERPKCGATR